MNKGWGKECYGGSCVCWATVMVIYQSNGKGIVKGNHWKMSDVRWVKVGVNCLMVIRVRVTHQSNSKRIVNE